MLNILKDDFDLVFSRGINTDTPEIVAAIIAPCKNFFKEVEPEFKNFRKPEKVDLVKNIAKFFKVSEECLTTVQAIDLHNMLKEIRA
jgi:hypothetical protein